MADLPESASGADKFQQMRQMDAMFGTSADQMRKLWNESFDSVFKNAIDLQKKYERIVQTSERRIYETKRQLLMQMKEEILKQKNDEQRLAIQNLKDHEAQRKAIMRSEENAAKKLIDLERSNEDRMKQLRVDAERSEREGISKVTGLLQDKMEGYKKSLMDTKTIWEASLAVVTLMATRLVDVRQAQTALRNAGFNGSASLTNMNAPGGIGGNLGTVREHAFGGLRQSTLASESEIDAYVGLLGKTHDLMKEASTQSGGQKLQDFIGVMGAFGVSIEDAIKAAASGNKEWAAALDDMNRDLRYSAGVSRNLGINAKDAFSALMRFSNQLRNVSFDESAASKVLATITAPLKDKHYSQDERLHMAESTSQFVGGLSPSKLAGMFAFTNGHMPSAAEMKEMKPFETMLSAARKMIGQVPEDQQLYAAESMAGKFLPGVANTKMGAEGFLSILKNPALSGPQMEAAVKELTAKSGFIDDKSLRNLQKEGFQALKDSKNVFVNLEKALTSLVQKLGSPLTVIISGFNSGLGVANATSASQLAHQAANGRTGNPLTDVLLGQMQSVSKRLSPQGHVDHTRKEK